MDDVGRALAVLHETIAPATASTESTDLVVRDGETPGTPYANQWNPSYWTTLSEILGGGASTGPASMQDAIQISAVLVCLDVLAQDIAKTPLRLMKKVRGGAEEVMPNEHWLAAMLADEPNEHHTWPEFIEMVMLHLGLVQNAFIVKKMTRTGQTTEMVPVIPGHVSIDVNEDLSDYVYRISLSTMNEAVQLHGYEFTLRPDQIIHLRGRMFDGLYGYSTLAAGAKSIGLAKEVTDFQRRLYEGDGATRGVFELKDDLGDTEVSNGAFQRLKADLAAKMRKFRRSFEPIVLEGGLTFKSISQTSDQAEVAKARDAAIVDMCRLFRMPPHKAMHLQAVKYENLEAMERSYVADTLIPYAQKIEHRLRRALLSPAERPLYFLEFDREAMMLADIQHLTGLVKVLLSHGVILVDEARRMVPMRLNPLPNGAGRVRLVPSTYSVVSDSGEVLIPAGAQSSAEDGGEDDSGDAKNKPKSGESLRLVS